LSGNELVTCPDCQGTRSRRYLTVGGVANGPCARCCASGRVTQAEAERVATGRRRYEDRVSRGVSLRDEAARLGLTPRELADIEHARIVRCAHGATPRRNGG
jgi:hypothetical protein